MNYLSLCRQQFTKHSAFLLKIILLLSLSFLPACQGWWPERFRIKSKSSNIAQGAALDANKEWDFNSYLALEYSQFAASLRDDAGQAEYFAKKGLDAASGKEIWPEDPKKWGISPNLLPKVEGARQKLVALINSSKKPLFAGELARMMVLYDCSVIRVKKAPREAIACQESFMELAGKIPGATFKSNLSSSEIQHTLPQQFGLEIELNKFEIYFDSGSVALNDQANAVFLDLLNYLGDLQGDYQILIVSTTDRIGPKLYGDALTRKRALLLEKYLIRNGVPEGLISIRALGESYPPIALKPRKSNPNNRKVSIYVLKGSDEILSSISLPSLDSYIYKQEISKAKKQRRGQK